MPLVKAQRLLRSSLAEAGIETAALDARLLISAVTGLDATAMARQPERMLSAAEQETLIDYQTQRLAHRPVSKIIGRREFWGRAFIVNDAVLDPRPDSETLIEAALAHMPMDAPLRIMDLGTGSGCLLVTLLAERAKAQGIGVDKSPAALLLAQENAAQLDVAARAQFIKSDWFTQIDVEHVPSINVMISNPPYISTQEMAALASDVAEYDPQVALHGGDDGLDAYRIICAHAGAYLADNGWLIFEIGYRQAEAVSQLLQAGGFGDVRVLRDLAGHNRVVMGQLSSE